MTKKIFSKQERAALAHRFEQIDQYTPTQLLDFSNELMLLLNMLPSHLEELFRDGSDINFMHKALEQVWDKLWTKYPAEADKAFRQIAPKQIARLRRLMDDAH